MESLTLQVDGPITRRAYIWGALTGIFFCLQVDGLITGGRVISRGLITRILRYQVFPNKYQYSMYLRVFKAFE